MFKLSRRKGSAKWQVRKRWPSDVTSILRGEFNVSTGEEDKRAAQQRLPLIAAEYEKRVEEARAKLSEAPKEHISEAEALRMAADFYRLTLPTYTVTRQLDLRAHAALLQETKERLGTLKQMMGRNEFGPVAGVAREMVKRAGADLPDGSPSWGHVQRLLMRALVELNEAAVANLSGEPEYVPSDPSLLSLPENQPKHTIEALIDAYEADKSPSWSDSSKKAVRPVFRFLRELFTEREAASLTREEAREAVELLQSLPTNVTKRKETKDLSAPEAALKNRDGHLPSLSPKSVNDAYLMHISSMFNWARKEQWVPVNPFEGLSVHDPVDDADRRDPFTSSQLQKLFSEGPWVRPWEPDREGAGDFWVPLLCLFHGLRLGEAAGLRVEDVEDVEGTPCIHLRAYDNRSLKTKEARGTLPLHPELLRLGFLAHVMARKADGEELVFEEGTANNRGQVGTAIGKRFSRLVKRQRLEGRKLGMHSFRHNFEDRLREAELPDRTALALARRKEAGARGGYGDGLSINVKANAISLIKYPDLNLSHLQGIEMDHKEVD